MIPLLDVSAGSSGLALVGAATFGDRAYLDELRATLELGAFPVERDGGVTYAAGNQVGDAVLLYALELGPMWRRVQAPRGLVDVLDLGSLLHCVQDFLRA